MARLSDLVKKLQSLGTIPPEAIAAGAAYANRTIRAAGESGGSLHEGNAAVASVETNGLSMSITRVHSTKGKFPYGIRNDFLANWIANYVRDQMQKRLK